jgi:hypothetical protein
VTSVGCSKAQIQRACSFQKKSHLAKSQCGENGQLGLANGKHAGSTLTSSIGQ